jgi:nondiscriminating glutamyl-tRNA synthetase
MVMRIEDTDLERSRREYEDEIIESLQWLGIKWGEGIAQGGEKGPYRQTERLEIYRQYTQMLMGKGSAYYCFCTQEELENERQEQLASGKMQRYSGKCSDLSDQEIEERLKEGIKPSIRFRVPQNKIYVVDDLVRGRVSFDSSNSGDFIIVKSDGIPVYNFAVVIDDFLMEISHVIRAEEHLSNTPRQIMLFEALNFARPDFAHISLILGNDRQKMSKRHGATSLVQYREMGYLPEALFNFLALLGWSPQGEEEILSPEEIIKDFTLDRVAKSPAVFDLDKLNWVNQQYLKKKSTEELAAMLKTYIKASEYAADIEQLDDFQYGLLVEAVRDHLVCLSDVTRYMDVFFREAVYEEEALSALKEEGVMTVLQEFRDELPLFSEPAEVKDFIKAMVKKLKLKPKNVYMPLRSALSGQTHGPELPFLILIWGREESLRRIDKAIAKLSIQ